MLLSTGRGEDSQWFDYRPQYFGPVVRVEWELDTMDATIARDAAEWLINHGYATRLSPAVKPDDPPQLIIEEPVVTETIDTSSSAPSADATASVIPPEAPPAPTPSPTPPQAPPAAANSPIASSGGKQSKKERRS